MNKLDSMPGQLFRIIADAAKSRGGARSGGATAGGAPEASGFRQLLRTMSQQSKSTSSEPETPESVKRSTSRFQVSQSPVLDDVEDQMHHSERSPASDRQESTAGSFERMGGTGQPDAQHRLPPVSLNGADTAVASMVGSEVRAFKGDLAPATTQAAAPTSRHNVPAGTTSTIGGPDPAALPEVADSRGERIGALATARGTAESGFETIAANLQSSSKLSSRDASAPQISKVSVIQQETHFPPVAQTAPQQIADAVIAELKGSSAVTAPDPASPSGNGPDQPLKVLTIRLDPPSLGSVTVQFRLTGDAVSIHLAADRRDTTRLLEEQRDSIKELMRSAGYVADVASVQHGSLDGLRSGSPPPQSTFGGQPQQQSQASPDTFSPSSGDAQNGARQPRQEREQNQGARHEQDMVPHNRRGALFV